MEGRSTGEIEVGGVKTTGLGICIVGGIGSMSVFSALDIGKVGEKGKSWVIS